MYVGMGGGLGLHVCEYAFDMYMCALCVHLCIVKRSHQGLQLYYVHAHVFIFTVTLTFLWGGGGCNSYNVYIHVNH